MYLQQGTCLQHGEPKTLYWLGKKVQIVEAGDRRLEGIQKRPLVHHKVFLRGCCVLENDLQFVLKTPLTRKLLAALLQL